MARPKAAAMDFRAKMMEQAKKRWEETLRNSATKQNEVSISTVRADAALESLNKILEKGKFNTSHGGSVSFEKPVELCLKDGPHVIKFPLSAEDEQKLLKVCEQASFGKGKEEVLDPEYRQALRLEGDKFFTSFDLHTTSLLGEIQAALCPDQKNVTLTAELDKLNVYTKGGFFKKHQDTPRGNDVIGTLTLVLPTSFEGGELVVDGRGDSAAAAVFGWPDKVRLQYAAFFSDSQHEIKPVTSGCRVSIAYNLISKPKQLQSAVFPPLATELAAQLENADFMPEGGQIGYHCNHLYPVSEDKPEVSAACLKGCDAAFMSTAALLGLDSELYAIWNKNATCHDDDYRADNDMDMDDDEETDRGTCKVKKVIFSKKWQAEADKYDCVGEDDGCMMALDRAKIPCKAPQDIMWINNRSKARFQKGMAVAAYGNQPSHDFFYNTAAIVIKVPAKEDRKALAQQIFP